MAYFRTDTRQMDSAAAQMSEVVMRMNTIRLQVYNAGNALKGGSAMIKSSRTKIKNASDDILTLIYKANELRLALRSISESYSENESRIRSNADPISGFRPWKFVPGVLDDLFPGGIIPLPLFDWILKPRGNTEYVAPYDPLLWMFGRQKGVFKLFEKLSGAEIFGGLGSVTGFASNWTKLVNSDPGSKNFWSSLFGTGSDGAGIVETVYDFMKDSKGKMVSGIVGNVMGVASEVADLWGMTPEQVLKNASNLVEEGVGIFDKYLGPDDLKGWESLDHNTKLSAATSAISMGLYAIGDVRERAADGTYDLNDYGETLLGTGMVGATTLIEGVTFGIVDIDPTEAGNTFRDNSNRMSQIIQDTGAPTWAQCAMVVPGAVVVTVWSAGEVAVDTVTNAWNNFTGLFK